MRRSLVEAPARLHFGVLDLRGSLGRWFGGVGAAAPGPSLLVSASPSSTLRCEGVVVSRGRQIATAEARLVSAEGKLLAHGTSTLIILPPRG